MLNTLKIGRPFGINTYVHWSFWLLPLVILLSGVVSSGPVTAVVDTTVILAVFACVGLHELGHALAARQYGIRTRSIVLYPLGGVASLERMPRSPMAEIVVALAGPAVNVIIAIGLAALMMIDGYSLALSPRMGLVELFWTKLLYANVGLAVFNMIPAFPMDGGRVLRAVLSWFTSRTTATEIAASVGIAFAVIFGIGAVIGIFSPMMLILAVFLAVIGQQELRSVRHEEAVRDRPPTGRFIEYFVPRTVPVTHADGWEYDAQSRLWTYWRNGVAMKRVASMG